jgi:hypothetical protein
MTNDYELQARRFLTKFNLTLEAKRQGIKCPPWGDCKKTGKHIHGDGYLITIKRTGADAHNDMRTGLISFEFWNSLHAVETGESPTSYDVLACISNDINMPVSPDEIYDEFGGMKPSQAIAIAEFGKKLRGFFSSQEQTALSEIQ